MATLIRTALLVLALFTLFTLPALAGDYGNTDPAPDVLVPDGVIEPPAATEPVEEDAAAIAPAPEDPHGETPTVEALDEDLPSLTDSSDDIPADVASPTVDPASVDAAVARQVQTPQRPERLALPSWNEEQVLTFILRSNPVLTTQQAVTREYRPPTGMERIYHNTTVFARVGSNGAAGGVQINIPLDSPLERRQYREKLLAEMTAMDGLRARVLEDISLVRQTEADLRAARMRLDFLEDRAAWTQDRVKTGYGVVEELWAVTEVLSTERANHAKFEAMLRAQRRRLSSHAGDGNDDLHAYLQGTGDLAGVVASHSRLTRPPTE